MTTVVKATTKGQITLPAAWRRKYKTSYFILKSKKEGLEISPLSLASQSPEKDEYTVFDALRDNRGQGIKAGDLVDILKKLQ